MNLGYDFCVDFYVGRDNNRVAWLLVADNHFCDVIVCLRK